jgi:hypothetical protein
MKQSISRMPYAPKWEQQERERDTKERIRRSTDMSHKYLTTKMWAPYIVTREMRMRESRNPYKVLVEKREGTKPVETKVGG